MNAIQGINRTMLLAMAPFLGLMLFLFFSQLSVPLPQPQPKSSSTSGFAIDLQSVLTKLDRMNTDAVQTRSTIEKYYELYAKSSADSAVMVQTADAASKRPAAVFDSRISAKLGGKPSRSSNSSNVDLKLFTFNETNYQGYALKVDLRTEKGMAMVLGNDKVGGSETTLSAARRYGAIAGVNAGGFADDSKTGKRFPLSTTVMNGKYVYGFEPTFEDLTFIGMSTDRKLIGGKFSRQEDLDKLKPAYGATFVPVLLQNGKKQPIPPQWLNSPARAPRTVVGNFKNDQLLFMVTDGFDERGNSGATLSELQDKLLALGVKDAYNLDGGGSSTLIFDGQVINRPSDNGRLRPLATHFLFFK
ncbi:phosphodiester glycosidase family protein [Paenibacillus filicis]|uniref:Phosphodiester glycosidase family protein n=1 Tax=Paenibacillus gyeongsangnamensis TaxID=3388067 RepID=A0ABT4QHW6_9BACL|nr:phosphodiester glycosidase family protein [Paenibacillus filicis]MCZ8516453.1 phosphodiester glycosidase family protein [Paenibacillus filicis]